MPAIGDIYQVTYQQTLEGQTMENVIHFREITGASTPAQINTAVQTFLTTLSLAQSNQVVYTAIIVKQMTPLAFDERILTPTTTTGANSSPAFNNTIAIVCTKRTGTAGKTHRGRIYIGGPPGTFTTDGNRLNATGASAMGTVTSTWMSTYGPTGTDPHLQIGVYSRVIGGSLPFTVAGWQPLSSIDTQIIFGNQRRRRIGVGI